MERRFDSEIQKAKNHLMNMGTESLQAISKATSGLQKQDVKQLKEVFEIEHKVDLMNISVDDACLKLLALQSLVAKDLRLVVAMIKTNSDIERIADRANNLARIGCEYLAGEKLSSDFDLAALAAAASGMVQGALQAFMHLDTALARSIMASDIEVDQARDRIAHQVLEYLRSRPEKVAPGMHIILLARNLERIADHATNIAENAIFAMSGEDVRHHAPLSNGQKSKKSRQATGNFFGGG